MVVSDTASMINELTIALLTSEFGQVQARSNFRQHALRNTIWLCKPGATKLHMTLGKIGQDPTSGNMLYEILYDFVNLRLQNRIGLWARANLRQLAAQNSIQLCKTGTTKSHTTLGKIGHDPTLGNMLHKIPYDFVNLGLHLLKLPRNLKLPKQFSP